MSTDQAIELQPHQQRVVAEKNELDARLTGLLAFFSKPIFASLSEGERARLRAQSFFMIGYSSLLAERIDAFSNDPVTPAERPHPDGTLRYVGTKTVFARPMNRQVPMAHFRHRRAATAR